MAGAPHPRRGPGIRMPPCAGKGAGGGALRMPRKAGLGMPGGGRRPEARGRSRGGAPPARPADAEAAGEVMPGPSPPPRRRTVSHRESAT